MAATLLAGTADAAQVNYQIELVLLHSNNLNLSEDNQAVETVFIPRLTFDVKEEGSKLTLQARGELERLHYANDTFNDETRSEFAGQMNWSLAPQRLNLVFEDYLSEEPIDFRDGRYPGNLQRMNVFLGGPTFFANVGRSTKFQLDVRAADTYAEVTDGLNSKRYSAAAALQRDLTETSRASLNLVSMRAEFDDPAAAVDYTRHDGFVRYERSGSHIDYSVDAGYARLHRATGENVSKPLGRALLQWQIDPRNRLGVRARYEYGDAVQDLVVRLSDPSEALVPELAGFSSLVSPGIYHQRDFRLDYRFTGSRLNLRLQPRYLNLDYVDNSRGDRTEHGLFFQASYQLRPRLDVFLDGFARKREYLNQPRQDIDHLYRLGLEYRLSRHWSWQAELIRNTRNSNQADPRYTEDAVQFIVAWAR